jgi:YVTN family beta-propeller protein
LVTFVNEGYRCEFRTSFLKYGQTRYRYHAEIPLGADPSGLTYDTVGGRLFIGNTSTDRIEQYDLAVPGSFVFAANLSLPHAPGALLYDAMNGLVYAAEPSANSVAVVNPGTGLVVANISVGSDPSALALNLVNGLVVVANANSSSISFINGTSNTVHSTLSVDKGPAALLFDPADGSVMVACSSAGIVEEVLGSSVVTSLSLGGPLGALGFDPATGDVWVGNVGTSAVDVLVFG